MGLGTALALPARKISQGVARGKRIRLIIILDIRIVS